MTTLTQPEFFTFNGGERHVRFKLPKYLRGPLFVTAHLRSSQDIMDYLLFANALSNQTPTFPVYWSIPYLPFARQDRVCSAGEAHSLNVMLNLLESTHVPADGQADRVEVWDVHNAATLGGWDMCYYTDLASLVTASGASFAHHQIVSPDHGALQRASSVRKVTGRTEGVLMCEKTRDPETGRLSDPRILGSVDPAANYLIVDDICDGGGTFIQLARKLREEGATRIDLLVTHGIFSKPLNELSEVIDHCYTYNSFLEPKPSVSVSVSPTQPTLTKIF